MKALEDAVQGLKGEQHVSDQLQSEVERFNDEAQRRYDQMKNTFMILFGMEIGDVEFVGVQYFNFCERTACSYFGSWRWPHVASRIRSPVRCRCCL